nr:reverse transcriptase domain-containing protein [Tanacetum cinerariifolium]
MVRCQGEDRKRKSMLIDEEWMNVPVTFPPVLARDISNEALVIEVEVEGYFVRRIHVDEGVSIEIMYEHCFNMLDLSIRARMTERQTTMSGFSREHVNPLRKIELDVCLSGNGLCRSAMMKFRVIPTLSPYNIILDFLNEIPVGSDARVPNQAPQLVDGCGIHTMSGFHTDGASNPKGSGAGLVLISPTRRGYTYALWLNFSGTNNQAEYEALLARSKVEEDEDNWMTLIIRCLEKVTYKPTMLSMKFTWGRVVCTLVQGPWWQKQYDKGIYGQRCIVTQGKRLGNVIPVKFTLRYQSCQKPSLPQSWPFGRSSTVARPHANELVERANRSLMEGIKARLGRERSGWPNIWERGGDPSKNWHVDTPNDDDKEGDDNEEEIRLNLDLLQERREASAVREAKYKAKIEQYYNKRVRHVSFRVGSFVHGKNEAIRVENLGKLGLKWEGPYQIVEAYHNGSYKLKTIEDQE